MAETSGFVTDLPQSAYLSLSMRRAISAAQQRSHRYVTLEHLLLALLDDPDALALLEAVRADISAIKTSAADTVNRNLVTLYTPGQFDLRASYKVERVLQTASDDADRLSCPEVDAAFVLAALSREGDNPAGDILKRNSFAYPAAMTWLYSNRGKSFGGRSAPAKAAPAPAPTPPKIESAPITEPTRREEPSSASQPPSDDDLDELDFEILDDGEPETLPPPRPEAANGPISATPMQRQSAPAPASAHEMHEEGGTFHLERRPSPEAMPRAARQRETGNGSKDPNAAPVPLPRRFEQQMPSAGRLDEMRVRGASDRARLAPAPAPPPPQPAPKKRPVPQAKVLTPAAPDKLKSRARRQPRPHEALIGRLIENIPRRMRAAIPERIEVRISREETEAIARGMEGRAEPVRHDVKVTNTMSVLLRAPDGGFNIEPLSPETQWVFDRPDASEGETYGRWRWVVTPSEAGQRKLQLIVAARSIDQNGLAGDTALPDQIITVQVNTNYVRSLTRALQWIMAIALGGALTELAMFGMRFFAE